MWHASFIHYMWHASFIHDMSHKSHIWTSHVTHITHMNESCHASAAQRMTVPRHTYQINHVHICHAYKGVMSHIWMSPVSFAETYKLLGGEEFIGCLTFISHFPEKSPIISVFFAESDLTTDGVTVCVVTCHIYEDLDICITHIHICGMNLCALYISTRVTSYIYECVKAHTNYISTRVTSYIYECCGICVNAHIRICVKAHIFVWKHTQIHTYRCEWVLSHRQIACEWVMSRRQTSVWIQHILRNNILVPLSTLTSQCREVGKYAWHDSQLQCAAVCGSVLQRVTACCSVLQCVAVSWCLYLLLQASAEK